MEKNDQTNQKPFQYLTGTKDLFLFSKYLLFQLNYILVFIFTYTVAFQVCYLTRKNEIR